jgi:hypothetical protein
VAELARVTGTQFIESTGKDVPGKEG